MESKKSKPLPLLHCKQGGWGLLVDFPLPAATSNPKAPLVDLLQERLVICTLRINVSLLLSAFHQKTGFRLRYCPLLVWTSPPRITLDKKKIGT